MRNIGVILALGVVLGACSNNSSSPSLATVVVSPVLDSAYVGDSLPARQVAYFDAAGTKQDPGTVRWASSNPAIVQVDSLTGAGHAVSPGFAQVIAYSHSLQGSALVVVSRALQVTLLLDSLLLMPGDTITIPVHLAHQAPGVPTVWFSASTNAVFSLDSASGRDSARAPGGPIPFVVHAALGADTTADSGTVEVLSPIDTTGGRAAYAMFGTVIRSVKSAAEAYNYQRTGDSLTFRLRAFIAQGTTTVEAVVITVRVPVSVPGAFPIDSLSADEALGSGGADPVCRPPRNWASWSTIATNPRIDAVSRPGGEIVITQVKPLPGGYAISGRFEFPARRLDLYNDPLGTLPIFGTFVTPLTTTTTTRCIP
jgi:hypothetical protein